jgi:hypothetical protein
MKYPNDPVLEAREKTHGDFKTVAFVSQRLKCALHADEPLAHTRREALEMICTKIARIVCGDDGAKDHWEDIAGYARLIVVEIEDKKP